MAKVVAFGCANGQAVRLWDIDTFENVKFEHSSADILTVESSEAASATKRSDRQGFYWKPIEQHYQPMDEVDHDVFSSLLVEAPPCAKLKTSKSTDLVALVDPDLRDALAHLSEDRMISASRRLIQFPGYGFVFGCVAGRVQPIFDGTSLGFDEGLGAVIRSACDAVQPTPQQTPELDPTPVMLVPHVTFEASSRSSNGPSVTQQPAVAAVAEASTTVAPTPLPQVDCSNWSDEKSNRLTLLVGPWPTGDGLIESITFEWRAELQNYVATSADYDSVAPPPLLRSRPSAT